MAESDTQPSVQQEFSQFVNKLFKDNKSNITAADLEFSTGGYVVTIASEILHPDTADTGSEVRAERVKEGAKVPENFDIDTVITVDETELLIKVKYYIRRTGEIEVLVSYTGFDSSVVPLDVFTSIADDKMVQGLFDKLQRAVALFPEGDSSAKPKSSAKPRAPKKGGQPTL